MRAINTVLIIFGVIGIIVLMAAFTGFVLFSLDPPIKTQLSSVPVSADALKSFDQKIVVFKQKIEAGIAAKDKREVVLTITSEEVNSKIVELVAQGDLPLKETLINFDNDLCKVYTVFNNPGVSAKIGVVAQLMVNKGNIKIVTVDFQVGRLPLQQSLIKNVGSILDVLVKMEGATDELQIDVTGVSVSDGRLTIRGMTRTTATSK
jgi:hypothetical protein